MTKTELLLSRYGIRDTSCTKHTASGKVEIFDEDFVKAFDNYCMSSVFPMTKSQYNNIKLFIEHADDQVPNSSDKYYKMKALDNHLVTIGVEQ